MSKAEHARGSPEKECREKNGETKKSGLVVATLISTPNPVSQVLW
jgi:hypothetical protein